MFTATLLFSLTIEALSHQYENGFAVKWYLNMYGTVYCSIASVAEPTANKINCSTKSVYDIYPNVSGDFRYYPFLTKKDDFGLYIADHNMDLREMSDSFEFGFPMWVTGSGDMIMWVDEFPPTRGGSERNLWSLLRSDSRLKITNVNSLEAKSFSVADVGLPIFPIGNGDTLFAKWIMEPDSHSGKQSLVLVVRDRDLQPVKSFHSKVTMGVDEWFYLANDNFVWVREGNTWCATSEANDGEQLPCLDFNQSGLTVRFGGQRANFIKR